MVRTPATIAARAMIRVGEARNRDDAGAATQTRKARDRMTDLIARVE